MYTSPLKFQRRWHGHAIFPILIALGGRIEVRASWYGYLAEFCESYTTAHKTLQTLSFGELTNVKIGEIQAITWLKPSETPLTGDGDDVPLSSFEAKYVQVGQPIYQVVIHPLQMD